MATHSAFFYGTLMVPEVLRRVIHGSSRPQKWQQDLLTVRPAILHGHQRHRVALADYPAILASADDGACVRGTLVTGLTEGDLWRLDIFEGDEYERKNVKVKPLIEQDSESHEGDEIEAQTYLWIAGEDQLEKQEWDFDEFVREKMNRWIGADGDDEYAEVDEAVKADGKDPTAGRGRNGHITRQLESHNNSSDVSGNPQ